MISAAQAGLHEDGRETYGHSLIIDPWGRILAQGSAAASPYEPTLIMAQIDHWLVDEARRRIPTLNHARDI
jgi:deaminated glutathione amidase